MSELQRITRRNSHGLKLNPDETKRFPARVKRRFLQKRCGTGCPWFAGLIYCGFRLSEASTQGVPKVVVWIAPERFCCSKQDENQEWQNWKNKETGWVHVHWIITIIASRISLRVAAVICLFIVIITYLSTRSQDKLINNLF